MKGDRRTHHCEVCEFKHYCGGCRARADAYFGDVKAGEKAASSTQSAGTTSVLGDRTNKPAQ
jgi:MoaA/NifB/PqqE/SkfB family radical SAM enzyme